MDPVGPWSAYASYNRLTGVQAAGGAELHHLTPGTPAGAPPTTTATSLISGGFLSPPPVGYETVFSPLFHHAGAKPTAHYVTQVTQHRQALAQAQAASKHATEGEYHQGQAFFEPGTPAWQQNSPFGILPHESVVPSTTAGKAITAYENFNAHFAAAQSLNHLNTQLTAAKNVTTRAQSPQITNASVKVTSQTNAANFFQVPVTFASAEAANKFATTNASNLQQSCIVSSSSISSTSKDYRVPPATNRTAFLPSPTPSRPGDKSFVPPTKQTQIQTKAQTKIYPELSNHADRQRNAPSDETQNQPSPVSFSIMDASSRLSYASNISSVKRPQFQHSTNYRHYQPGNNTEPDFQRSKAGTDYSNSNGPDCNVVVPRRPSPLQAHSQASPLGHAPSPAYPMYNSPMNSMSSPQQSSNHVTPPSPLDVTVSRPNSQSGNVAYPSVITRALNTEKNFPDRYDRSGPNAQTQSCWEDRQVQQRKFQPLNNYNATPTIESARQMDLSRGDQTQQRASLPISDRQPYFDSTHQVPLQDLSSCRGDPMSLVKNLQHQQSCQIQQQISDIKQETKAPNKRRKSSDKMAPSTNNTSPAAMTEYFAGRIPPPAHSSANPQQQNGTYFDFDRWNLPPSTTKMFASQAMHQQHQGLMVPHPHPHHPPPPLPYFAPFHLAPHPGEYPTSVDTTMMATYNEQPPQHASSQFLQQEEPKVVVPNIEEELNFLSEGTGGVVSSGQTQPTARPPTVKSDKPTGPGAGFMNSYLKFLQGERDSSPPPMVKGARKQTWSRAKPAQPEERKDEVNGIVSQPPPPPPTTTRLSQGDPQDDPRYFPLPKERKRNCFDSSDDGFSSDEDLFNKKVALIVKNELTKEKPMRKGRPSKPRRSTDRKRARQKLRDEDHEIKADIGPVDNLPRRESTKRAAKEKSNFQQLMAKQGDEDLEEPAEFMDSDSDPAWTPQARDDMEEELMHKRPRKSKQASRKRASRNLISAAAQGAGIQVADSYNEMIGQMKQQKPAGANQPLLPPQKQSVAPTLEDNIAAAVAQQNSVSSNVGDDNPFKPGEFLVIKNELNEEWPAIWRVDGKTLLQKYEPFEQGGQTLYRNISTYTSWTADSKKQYIPIPVKYRSQGQLETIVEFLRNELVVIDQEFLEKAMTESEVYQDNFEVYIQTLISQALDSNFLMEIFQEQDEYFLTNVQTIDDITNNKKQKMITLLKWPNPVQVAVSTWPCFNVIRELNALDSQLRPCGACLKPGVSVRVLMYGQPYNATTLEGCQPTSQILEKDFLMCRICASRVELFNKITHQKYLMYVECAKRVAEKRATDPHKDTTCILNELLADEFWLTQLFCDVRKSWAEVDCLENSYRLKNDVQ
uniref:DUF4211 domain-containing protein n=1 Tax=Photinus pyralis TaxID=7054 RepID=A0A1Y1MPK1_PHOPY